MGGAPGGGEPRQDENGTMPSVPQVDPRRQAARADQPVDTPHARTTESCEYAELHCLSNFSFLRGASHPEELVEQAAELGYHAIAITDRNSLAGVVRAHVAWKKVLQGRDGGTEGQRDESGEKQAAARSAPALKLILGAEITPLDAPPIVLLATDRASYGRLCRLITRGRLRARKGDCRLLAQDVAELAEGLIGIVVGEGRDEETERQRDEGKEQEGGARGIAEVVAAHCVSPSLRLCVSAPPRLSVSCDWLNAWRTAFGADLYLAVTLSYDLPDARRLALAAEQSRRLGLPLVATNRVHYHIPRRRYLQDVLTCIREKCTLTEAGSRLMQNAERHLRPRAEIQRRYTEHAEVEWARVGRAALENTPRIAQRCRFSLDELRYDYPHELVPAGRSAMEFLEELVWRGAGEGRDEETERQRDEVEDGRDGETKRRRDGVKAQAWHARGATEAAPAHCVSASLRLCVSSPPPSLSPSTRTLLTAELNLIRELHYEHYFLTVWDLCRYARSRGILCQGRGSAANSAVCYYLGITAVDPTRHDLLFERFISRERNEPPDIDVDFEHERREEVFQYIYEKYGRERAAITAEVIRYRPRLAVREVGKVLGLSLDRVDTLAKTIDWWHGWGARERDEGTEEGTEVHRCDGERGGTAALLRHAGLDPSDRTIRMLVRLVKQLIGFPRHLSQHVGGFVITESPLCEMVPLENGAMPGRTFIEWDKDDIDALGILKVDCLALGMLTAIGKCFGLLGKGLRDAGIEGSRKVQGASGIPGLHGGTAHEQETDFSRLGRLAEGCAVSQASVYRDAANARVGEVRSHKPDAACRGVDPQQPCRGKCPAEPQRVCSFPDCGARIPDRAGDPVHHCAGAWLSVEGGRPPERHAGSVADASGVDRAAAPRPLIPESPSPLIPQSLLDIPPEDPAVYDMICAADTVGVFQIESRAQMSMLPRLKPRNFYDLVIEVAIVRPGPIQGGMVHPYLRRRDGLEAVSYPNPAVERVLKKTLGVPLFQEQVMRLAVVAAGFTPGEADQLRRAMAAWSRSGEIERFQLKLIRGMLERGYTRDFAESIYRQIQGFGEYGFPESHAASFALLVYASAWLKRYYPAAFCGALLNAQPLGFYTPGQLVRDAIQHGVEVRPVDVNHSGWDCSLEGRDGGRDEETERRRDEEAERHGGRNAGMQGRRDGGVSRGAAGPALRLGMRMIRGIRREGVDALEAVRAPRGRVESLADLLRAGVPRETLLRLAGADAFRSLGLSRRAVLWEILAMDERRHAGTQARRHEGRDGGTKGRRNGETPARPSSSLFSGLPPGEPAVSLPAMPLSETVVQDYDSIGFSLNAHPVELIRQELNALRVIPAAKLARLRNGQRVRVAGIVTCRQRPGTAKGVVFITLEDEGGMCNLIVRPEVWERDCWIARNRLALLAEGKIERQGPVVHVMATQLHDLSRRLVEIHGSSRDFH